MAEKNGHKHFMHKEIHEQARALTDTIRGRASIEEGDVYLDGCHLDQKFVQRLTKVQIVACGTSWHASLTGKLMIETLARIPVEVDLASEFRYRQPLVDGNTLCVAVSQSGETADTLGSFREAKSRGARGMAICNVVGSAIAREADDVLYTHAGPEIGVASTKAFTTQLTGLFLLTLTLAKLRARLKPEDEERHMKALRHLPTALSAVLALEPQVIAWAERFAKREHALFLGRGVHYPIALEGALKLKEISYIHAEAYPAGELKHGPLALVTGEMPVVTVAPNDALLEKLKSNIQEVRARGGQLYVFADADTKIVNDEGLHVIRMPEHYGLLSPILHVVPLQLLAYHTACARGTDVDKPRNLAKSVTVE
jgi:glucosamine--fructose-6-phosphate aminotransferase (isomerizing)